MARGRNSKSEKEESAASSLEVGMLCKSAFNDSELESYLRQGEIKASEKPPVPPQVLWVGDCTIATFGNFSASTGKAKSKKTFNITAMVAAALTNSTVLNYRASFPEGKRQILYFDTEQSRYHCHNVVERIYRLAGLSLNKNDNNTRGHIGTELENKAETVLIISKNKQDANISEVRPMHMRDKEFSSWAFHIDDNSLPVLDVGYHVTVVKPKDKPLTSLPDDVHTMVLQKIFSKSTPQRYVDLVKALGEAYAEEGYKRGDNAVKEMLKIFNERKLITKEKDGYHYHPTLFPSK